LARRGTLQELAKRPVTVHEIRLLDYVDPIARFTVRCSKGTYVRTLCADMGERLGMGAHLTSLIRTRSGRFDLEQALTIEQAETLAAAGQAEQALVPLNDALDGFPFMIVEESDARRMAHGNTVTVESGIELPALNGPVRVLARDGRLLAIARAGEDMLRPEVVFA